METQEFKQKIYAPYTDAWKILKIVQTAGQTPKDDPVWEMYMREIDRLSKKYKGNPFVENLITMLLDAGDSIAKMNRGIV